MLVKTIDYFKDVFTPYPHQRELFNAFFSEEFSFYCLNWHRRAGKDAVLWNLCLLAAAITKGNYIYLLPKIQQSKSVIWEAKDLTGTPWLNKIPGHLLARPPNNTERKLYLTNGSIIHVTGADSILDSHLGSNLKGIFFSEYQRCHPAMWDYLRPIIRRSDGFAFFNYTSLAKGHAYHLFQKNINNPKWYTSKLTVDDTVDNEGLPIFSPAQIEEERLSGMDESLILQEYYCDETAAIKGTFFADQIELAHKEKRIRKGIQVEHLLPVHTSWDIGVRDTNSIWFFQFKKGQFYYFHQYNKNYGSIEHYAKYLEDIRKKYGFRAYGKHFMPHDSATTEWGTGKSRRVQLMEGGINIHPVPRLRVI